MQNNLKVTINGKQYTIATDENSQDICDAALLVDTLLKGKSNKVTRDTDEKTALIVALQIATDLAKTQRLLQSCEQKIEGLLALLTEEKE